MTDPNRLFRRAIAASLLLAAGALVVAGIVFNRSRRPAPESGIPQTIGDFEFGALGGFEPVTLAAFRGRPVVLNYFASWCAPCIKEMPEFQKVHADIGDEVTFLGVSVRDNLEDSLALVKQTGVTYRVAADVEGRSFDLVGARGMPTTLFIDANGKILERHAGPLKEEDIRRRVSQHFPVDG